MAEGTLLKKRAGRIVASEYYTTSNLSAALRERALAFGTPLGSPRYIVNARSERARPSYYHSIFELWDELDAVMWNATNLAENSSEAGRVGRKHAWQTGYVRELQVRRMVELVREPTTATYCEVGMNGAHSTVAMLLAKAEQN